MPKILCLVNWRFSIVCSFVCLCCVVLRAGSVHSGSMFLHVLYPVYFVVNVSKCKRFVIWIFKTENEFISTIPMFLVRTKRKINLFATNTTEVGQGIACKRYEIGIEFGHIEPFNLSQFYVVFFGFFYCFLFIINFLKQNQFVWKMSQFVWNL